MVTVEFQYRDKFSRGEWRKQTATGDSIREIAEWYGLGINCDYRILSVKDENGKRIDL